MSKDRLYTEKEISKIIKKAGEIQAAERDHVTMGLSLEEIQHLAEDFGLEADIIASVAEQIDREPEEEEKGFFSSLLMPTKLDVETIIPGNITEENWPEIVSFIERAVSKSGSSSQIGKLLEWTSESRHSVHKLSLIQGEDQTKVIYHGTFTQLALAWTLPIVINVGVWAFIIGMINLGLLGIPIGIVISLATYLAIVSGFKNFIKKKKKSIKTMFSRMSGLFTQSEKLAEKDKVGSGLGRIIIPEEETEPLNDQRSSARKKLN